jgi:hypothetical protein
MNKIDLKIMTWVDTILKQHSLKPGGTKDHFRWVKIPGTAHPLLKGLDMHVDEIESYLYYFHNMYPI